jgi:hypothetical protein
MGEANAEDAEVRGGEAGFCTAKSKEGMSEEG